MIREARSVFPDSPGILLAYLACFLRLSERDTLRKMRPHTYASARTTWFRTFRRPHASAIPSRPLLYSS